MNSIDLKCEGELATLVLNNPQKLNAINLSMWQSLAAQMRALDENPDVRCVVIRGAGDEAFAAGGDLEEFVTARATLAQAIHYHDQVAEALQAIAHAKHPTVALIQGACIGGGLEIAAACDLRICGEGAKFGAPINRLGFSMYPGANGRVVTGSRSSCVERGAIGRADFDCGRGVFERGCDPSGA